MHRPLARALAERGNRVVTLDLLGHGRSDRPQRHDALLDAVLRAADRSPCSTTSSVDEAVAGRDLAGRQRDARGGGARPRARARHGRRDAGARQRAAGLRDRLHAADGRPHLRRARHAPRARAGAAGPHRGRARCWPTSAWTPSARTPGPAPPSCTGCSSGAPPRTRSVRRTLAAPTLVIGHQRDPVHPFSDSDALVAELPNAPARRRPARSSSCTSARSASRARSATSSTRAGTARRRGGASRARRVA